MIYLSYAASGPPIGLRAAAARDAARTGGAVWPGDVVLCDVVVRAGGAEWAALADGSGFAATHHPETGDRLLHAVTEIEARAAARAAAFAARPRRPVPLSPAVLARKGWQVPFHRREYGSLRSSCSTTLRGRRRRNALYATVAMRRQRCRTGRKPLC